MEEEIKVRVNGTECSIPVSAEVKAKFKSFEEMAIYFVDNVGVQVMANISGGKDVVISPVEENDSETSQSINIAASTGTTVIRKEWCKSQTRLLINLREEYGEKLFQSKGKKSQVWKEIADRMGQHGYNVDGISCDNKWRRLKRKYITLRDKSTSGARTSNWEFFNNIESILNKKTCTPPRKNLLTHNKKKGMIFNLEGKPSTSNPQHEALPPVSPASDTNTHPGLSWGTRVLQFIKKKDERDRRLAKDIDIRLARMEKSDNKVMNAIRAELKRANDIEEKKLKLLSKIFNRGDDNST